MDTHYMRKNLTDTYTILELQDKILKIAYDIDKFCKNNEIEYSLMGGSALGAKRHGGFIPWDDDLDIFMTPDNYEKFRNCFNKNGNKQKYYLQEWGLTDGMVTFSKLRMNGTTFVEDILKEYDIHHGIYVDIFILHNCPNCFLGRLHQFFWAKYVRCKGLANRNYNRKKGVIGFTLKILRLLPEKFLIKHGLKQIYKYRNKKTKCYCNFIGKAVFKNAIYKKEFFDETEYVAFETIQLKAPKKLHEFLTERFGNYMTPPHAERIKLDQHAKIWDTKIDFKEKITDKEFLFKDEKKLI